MALLRLKGQEVSIFVVVDSELQAEITDITNFNMTLQMEVKAQGFLGEKAQRKDDVFNGVKFDFEMQTHSPAWLEFVKAILARAKRETPDVIFNIGGVFQYPGGETLAITLPDVVFGEVPINVPERGDYVKIKIDGECSTFQDRAA